MLDNETKQTIADTSLLATLKDNDAWNLAKEKLLEKLSLLNSVQSIPVANRTFEAIGQDTANRTHVISVVLEWLDEVESSPEVAKANRDAITPKDSLKFVIRT